MLSEQLAGVLTDDEIDTALAAFAAFGSDKKVDNDAETNLRRRESKPR